MITTISTRQKVEFLDLGTVPYSDAWAMQTQLNDELKLAKKNIDRHDAPIHKLIFCEHPPVYTLGKSGSEDHLRITEKDRTEKRIEYFKINRGGDITYHGPGQIVGYPIFDLDLFFTDVHRYVRSLEEVVIRSLAHYDLPAGRIPEFTGVWLDWESTRPRKICAIGVHMSRWVTMHGFAFNVNTDLSYYQHIIPCGIDISQKPVTSMQEELGRAIDMEEIKATLKQNFAEVFDFDYLERFSV